MLDTYCTPVGNMLRGIKAPVRNPIAALIIPINPLSVASVLNKDARNTVISVADNTEKSSTPNTANTSDAVIVKLPDAAR